MNPLRKALRYTLYAENDGEGNDLPSAQDRGDDIVPPELKEPEKHDDKVEDFTGEKADEAPRDPDTGKFAKRDRPIPEHVPRERMNEAVNQERAAREAAERRAAELEAQLRQETKSAGIQKMEEAVEALEKEHTKLLLDGEGDKAAAVMKEIRQSERAIARLETQETASVATAQAVEQVRFDAVITHLEATYDALNPNHEAFDPDLVDMVLEKQARLIQTDRMASSAALKAAADKVMGKFAPREERGESRGLAAGAKDGDRKKGQVEKNLDTARRQPASMKDSGKDSDRAGEQKIDVGSLTASEFDALPESTKRKLRGDDL